METQKYGNNAHCKYTFFKKKYQNKIFDKIRNFCDKQKGIQVGNFGSIKLFSIGQAIYV